MDLKDFLERERMSASEFARILNCHPQTIRSYLKGTRFPKYEFAKIIEDVTGGEVTLDDLLKKKRKSPPRCPCCHRVMFGPVRKHKPATDSEISEKELG